MYLGDDDKLDEDLAAVTRGNIVHVVGQSYIHMVLRVMKYKKNPLPLCRENRGVENAWQIATRKHSRKCNLDEKKMEFQRTDVGT